MIILSSSYSKGTRIALHCVDDEEKFKTYVRKVGETYGGKPVPFSTHALCTGDTTWESVVENDPYFDDVKVIAEVDDFIDLLKIERTLLGVDVAKYILSKRPCTHTCVESLTYLAYAEYMQETGKKLFEDNIYAFGHGPVVDTVFSKFSKFGNEHPLEPIVLSKCSEELFAKAIKSRINFSEDGYRKQSSIDKTLSKYSAYNGLDLVAITHRKDSPWSQVYSEKEQYIQISDDLIEKYRHVESEGI